MKTIARTFAVAFFVGAVPLAVLAGGLPVTGVRPQHDNTQVDVAAQNLDRFVPQFLPTGGGNGTQALFAQWAHRKQGKSPITHADLERWASAWSSHKVETAMALFSKDVAIDQPANPKP